MRTVQNRIFTLILTLLTGFFGAVAPVFSQQNAQSVYNSTVDQINCETIRFIHREAGRAEIANNMECFSFESILKSVPEDEARTTAQVAKDIEAFKPKYKADGDLAAQLDNVIAYANRKIEAKPRKGNVADFKLKLQEFKKDAIENISGAESGSGNTPAAAPATGGIDEETDEEGGIVLTDEEETTSAPGDTGWLTYLSLLLALLSLGFCAYLFTRLGKLAKELHAARLGSAEPDGNRSRAPQISDSGANYKLLESKMQQEISRISREFDDKLAAVTASTGYTQPESYSQAVEEDDDDEDDFLPTPLDQADAPILTTEERTAEPLIKNVAAVPYKEEDIEEEEDETPLPVVMEEVVEEKVEEEEYTEDDEQEENIEEEAAFQNTLRSDDADNLTTPAPQPVHNIPADDDEDEDGVALPDYKYLGLPLHDGSFAPNSFTDAPAPDSLYEVEMYEDVPNKAFFSPLLYPEVIEKALQDPEKYLAPCCMFLNEPAGKQIITVIEEGRLRRQGERWYIYEKARIRFD